MGSRPISQVLHEWRAAERELEEATDLEAREALEARIAALHTEYVAELDGHAAEAAVLGATPSTVPGDLVPQ